MLTDPDDVTAATDRQLIAAHRFSRSPMTGALLWPGKERPATGGLIHSMTFHDFNARAELYLGSDHLTARSHGGRKFRTAANALRFALEEAAPISLRGASLIVGDMTFSGSEMAQLYRLPNYPLQRKLPPQRPKSDGRKLRNRQASQHSKQNPGAAALTGGLIATLDRSPRFYSWGHRVEPVAALAT